jgi:hypothetical protein
VHDRPRTRKRLRSHANLSLIGKQLRNTGEEKSLKSLRATPRDDSYNPQSNPSHPARSSGPRIPSSSRPSTTASSIPIACTCVKSSSAQPTCTHPVPRPRTPRHSHSPAPPVHTNTTTTSTPYTSANRKRTIRTLHRRPPRRPPQRGSETSRTELTDNTTLSHSYTCVCRNPVLLSIAIARAAQHLINTAPPGPCASCEVRCDHCVAHTPQTRTFTLPKSESRSKCRGHSHHLCIVNPTFARKIVTADGETTKCPTMISGSRRRNYRFDREGIPPGNTTWPNVWVGGRLTFAIDCMYTRHKPTHRNDPVAPWPCRKTRLVVG